MNEVLFDKEELGVCVDKVQEKYLENRVWDF